VEELFYFADTVCGQDNILFLFINSIIPGFFHFIRIKNFCGRKFCLRSTLQLPGKHITDLIHFCGLSTLSGNNERCPGLVDQYGVGLINDGITKSPHDCLAFVHSHVVAEVIKPQLMICGVCDITRICRPAFLLRHFAQDTANRKTKETMNLPDLIRITLCQIIIYGDNVYRFSAQST